MGHICYYPVYLDIKDKLCAVIGGGDVAERKIFSVLKSGGMVRIVSPDITDKIRRLSENIRVTLIQRPYEEGDLRGIFMAFSATANREVNQRVAKEAAQEGVLLNIVDVPDMCDFIVPSIVSRGSLLLAISTSGKSPALAKKLRGQMEDLLVEEYAIFLDIMGAIRTKLLKRGFQSDKNKYLFEKIVNSSVLDWIVTGDEKKIDNFLENLLGKGFTLEELGLNTLRGAS